MQTEIEILPRFENYIDDWDYLEYVLLGGYGSGKSVQTAIKIVLKCFTEVRKVLVVREVYETIRESCFDLIYQILLNANLLDPAGRIGKTTKVIARTSPMQFIFPNGSKIIFKGMDKPVKLKSLNDVSIVWLEEAPEIKYAGFKELKGRIRHPDKSIHFILTMNPVDKNSWVYDHFFVHTDENGKQTVRLNDETLYKRHTCVVGYTYYHHSVPEDNYYLPKAYLHNLDEMQIYDPDLYRVAREGKFGVNGKKVLPQFEIAKNPSEFKKAVLAAPIKRNGFDFGFETSYNALVRIAVNTEQSILYIYDEWYRNQLTDKQSAEKLTEWNSEVKEWRVKCDCAQPGSIKYFHDEGFGFVKCHKISRLEQVKKVKRFKRIVCSPKCKNTIRELKDLVYKEDTNGNLIYDEFNIDPHTFSAIWYALDDVTVADIKEKKNNSRKGSAV